MTITINKTKSRSSGVAPCAVVFEATGTTDTATATPFHDCLFTWNFGDAAAGVFEYGAVPGQSKNVASGAVAAHVFENPGTYTVTLTVKSPDGVTVQTGTEVITVDDPDVVYAGANTICVANGGAPTPGSNGVPVGATCYGSITTLAAALAYLSTGKRLLFKRGDTFTSNTAASNIGDYSNFYVGSYGYGAPNAILQATANNAKFFSLQSAGSQQNFVIQGLILDGNGYTGVVGLTTAFADTSISPKTSSTIYQLEGRKISNLATYVGGTVVISGCTHDKYDADGTGTTSVFISNVCNSALLGNHLNTNGILEHNVRIQGAQKTVTSNNTLKDAYASKHVLTLRGSTSYICNFNIISSNEFDAFRSGAITNITTIQPQNSTTNEPIEDVIYERNFVKHSSTPVANRQHLTIIAKRVAVRSNIFTTDNTTAGKTVVISDFFDTSGCPHASDIWVYNNASIGFSTGGMSFLWLQDVRSSNIYVSNNVVYGPNFTLNGTSGGSGPTLLINTVNCPSVYLLNNSSDSQIKNTDPLFRGTPSGVLLNPHDLNIKYASYAKDAGTSVPVFEDFFGRPRTGTYDMGAFNYETTAPYAQSRVKGVGPLSVFFDAVSSYDAASTDAFHECVYEWNFGDKGDDLWAYGARLTSKNEAQGAVAAHVYETPGLYNVTCKITGKDGSVQYLTSQVTVEDPDVIFTGARTICVNPVGDAVFTGAPAGAQQINQNNFNTAIGLITSSAKRVLFKRGATYTTTGNANILQPGPGVVSAYGFGADPVIQTGTNTFKPGSGCEDWRIHGLQLSSTTATQSCVSLVEAPGKLLYHKLSFVGTGGVDGTYGTSSNIGMDQITISECSITQGASTTVFIPVYPKGTRWSIMGNTVDLGGVYGNQAVRIVNLQRGIITNNKFTNAGATNGTETIGVRANGSNLSLLCTKHVLVSKNEVSVFRYSGITCKASVNEDILVEDILIDSNYLYPGVGSTANVTISITTGNRVSVRNNIVLENGMGVSKGQALERAPNNIWFYNNSLYRAATSSTYKGFQADSSCTNIVIRNNVAYSPVGTNQQLFNVNGCTSYNADYTTTNSSNAQVAGTNPFSVGSPTSIWDYNLNQAQYAYNTGVSVPVHDDFFGRKRGNDAGAIDMGAIETTHPGYKYGSTLANIV